MVTKADLPDLFIKGNENANKGGVRCLRCGKPIKGKPVTVYQDFRIGGEFHDFGGIPDGDSEGPYTVAPDHIKADAGRLNRWREERDLYDMDRTSSDRKMTEALASTV